MGQFNPEVQIPPNLVNVYFAHVRTELIINRNVYRRNEREQSLLITGCDQGFERRNELLNRCENERTTHIVGVYGRGSIHLEEMISTDFVQEMQKIVKLVSSEVAQRNLIITHKN
jgi:hypothetical protein